MAAILKVRCPDCNATLHVDSRTGTVLDHEAAPRRKAQLDLEHAADQLRAQQHQRDSRFEQSVEAEKRREEVLARKFEESLRKAKDSPTLPPVRDIDLD